MVQMRDSIHPTVKARHRSARRAALRDGYTQAVEPANSFVGRDDESQRLRELILGGTQVITVVGHPGVGKTRLVSHVANTLAKDGGFASHWLDLRSIRSPELVIPTLARTLNIAPGHKDVLAAIVELLASRHSLLVLDNFEHVLPARLTIAELVMESPDLTVVITSRQPLRLSPEAIVALNGLRVAAYPTGAEASDAALLFVDRARAAVPDLRLEDEDDRAAVAEICRQLDGNPLALELAASRLRLFRSPAVLLTRLAWGILPHLVNTVAGDPVAHSSMTAAIDCSYVLLTQAQQALLRRLAVLEEGFSSAAAAAINGDAALPDGDVLGSLDLLVECGFVESLESDPTTPRFRMRPLVREYARDQLASADEVETVERRWVEWYLQVAETAADELVGAQQVRALRRLQFEFANLRAILQWAHDNGEIEIGARVASALGMFWVLGANRSEGLRWLARFRRRSQRASAFVRARLLAASGLVAGFEGDHAAASEFLDEACALLSATDTPAELGWALIYRGRTERKLGHSDSALDSYSRALALFAQSGVRVGTAWARLGLAHLARLGSPSVEKWAPLYDDALADWRVVNDAWGTGTALRYAALAAHAQGQLDRSADLYAAAIQRFRQLDWPTGSAVVLLGQGDVEVARGSYAIADALYAEAALLFRVARDQLGFARANYRLGRVLLAKLETRAAAILLRESLVAFSEAADADGQSRCFSACGQMALVQEDPSAAAQLLGAAHAVSSATAPGDASEFHQTREAARRALGDESFDLNWAVGAQLATAKAEALCRAILDAAVAGITRSGQLGAAEAEDLTAREQQVVVLIARGFKDRQIADELKVGRTTASWHVRNILTKLALSRAQVGVWALEQGLLGLPHGGPK